MTPLDEAFGVDTGNPPHLAGHRFYARLSAKMKQVRPGFQQIHFFTTRVFTPVTILLLQCDTKVGMPINKVWQWDFYCLLVTMNYQHFQQRVLHIIVEEERASLALLTLKTGLEGKVVANYLNQMVDAGLLELDSFDDGTLYYHAPGLNGLTGLESTSNDLVQRGRGKTSSILTVAAIVSVLDFISVGIGALIVYPHWEAELLMWIALAGAPGTLAVIVWLIYRWILPDRTDSN